MTTLLWQVCQQEIQVITGDQGGGGGGGANIQTPPLPQTPQPTVQMANNMQQKDPITGLTQIQDRLLSESDKAYYKNKNRTA